MNMNVESVNVATSTRVKKFGLLGYPLGHSMSNYIHKRIFEMCELVDCKYALYEIKPDELSSMGERLRELHGFNVTIPYKTQIIPYLDRLDESAAVYGSVNCVTLHETDAGKPRYIGYNTDGYGFLKALEALGASLDSRVLLLGCGGTGRMMAVEAIKAGAELTLAIRRDPAEEKAAAKLSGELREIAARNTIRQTGAGVRITYSDMLNTANSYNLLLNATPCGMHPNVDEIPITPGLLDKVEYLFDAIYNPYPTKLIREAQRRGVRTGDGMTMLVHQAVQAQRIWNDIQISSADTEKIIEGARWQL